jgi:hypothetical protein
MANAGFYAGDTQASRNGLIRLEIQPFSKLCGQGPFALKACRHVRARLKESFDGFKAVLLRLSLVVMLKINIKYFMVYDKIMLTFDIKVYK